MKKQNELDTNEEDEFMPNGEIDVDDYGVVCDTCWDRIKPRPLLKDDSQMDVTKPNGILEQIRKKD